MPIFRLEFQSFGFYVTYMCITFLAGLLTPDQQRRKLCDTGLGLKHAKMIKLIFGLNQYS